MERDRQAECGEIERQLGRKGRQWHNRGLATKTERVLFREPSEEKTEVTKI